MATVHGIVVDAEPGPLFIAAEQTVACVDSPRLSPVPGAKFSLMWFEGQVLVAVPLSACLPPELVQTGRGQSGPGPAEDRRVDDGRRSKVLICELGEERYALTGLGVLASGQFETFAASPEARRVTVQYAGSEVSLCTLEPPRGLVADADPGVVGRGNMFESE